MLLTSALKRQVALIYNLILNEIIKCEFYLSHLHPTVSSIGSSNTVTPKRY